MKCMTFCESLKKNKNDEWREQILSEKHLDLEAKKLCKTGNME